MPELKKTTVGKLLETIAAAQPETDAVVYPDRGLRLSYKQFDEECRRAAKGFMAMGIDKGDNIAIWSTNRPEWLTSQFSTGKMGAVLVTVNTNYRTSELEYLLKQCDATTFILKIGRAHV